MSTLKLNFKSAADLELQALTKLWRFRISPLWDRSSTEAKKQFLEFLADELKDVS
jgi:hypothetical protein